MDEKDFLILLQAKLDEAKSKGNINADINKIQGQLDKLKVQTEIDPNSIKNITQQLSKILNQSITFDSIKINSTQAVKNAQQEGQKISSAVNETVQQSINIDGVIDKQVSNLMEKYSIVGKKGSKVSA